MKSTNSSEAKAELSIEQIADYFKQHPDLFKQHPELLELINLKDDRGATSLLERQVAVLRERVEQSKEQTSKLINNVRNNEIIADNLYDFTCQLLSFNKIETAITALQKNLIDLFKVDAISFRVPCEIENLDGFKASYADDSAYQDTLARILNKQSYCDDRLPSKITNFLFANKHDSIKSIALVPLVTDTKVTDTKATDDNNLGILALGSSTQQRFTNDLGTAHLDRLGQVVAISLQRLL